MPRDINCTCEGNSAQHCPVHREQLAPPHRTRWHVLLDRADDALRDAQGEIFEGSIQMRECGNAYLETLFNDMYALRVQCNQLRERVKYLRTV